MRTIADRDLPPDEICEVCDSHEWERALSTPSFTRVSYLDGQRKNEKGWSDMKKSVKLEREALNKPPEERKRYAKEIRKLREVKK
jgi:hypothetical protein